MRRQQLARQRERASSSGASTPWRRRARRAGSPRRDSKYSANGISARARDVLGERPRSRCSSRSAASPGGAIGAAPSNGRPEACASRCRTRRARRARRDRRARRSPPRPRRAPRRAVASFVTDAQRTACRRRRASTRRRPGTRPRRRHARTASRRLAAAPPQPRHYRRWSASSSPRGPRSRSASGTRAPCASARTVWVSGTAPIMPGDADPPDDAYEQARDLPRDHRARARGGRRERSTTSCARGSTSRDAGDIDEVGRAHGEAFGDRPPGDDRRRRRAARPALARRDRGRGGDRRRRTMTELTIARRRHGERARPPLRRRRRRTRSASRRSTCCSTRETWDLVQHIDSVLAKVGRGRVPGAGHARADAVGDRDHDAGLPHACRGRRAAAAAPRATSRRSRAAEGCRFASRGDASVQPVRAAADHGEGPLPQARRADAVHRPARADLRHAHPHRGRRPREGDPGRERARSSTSPEFLALSASSPFWRGEPTGLASSRQMVFSAFPRSGVPPRFESYDDVRRARSASSSARAASPTTRTSGGTSAPTRSSARSSCGSATRSRASTTWSRSRPTTRRSSRCSASTSRRAGARRATTGS